MRRRNGKLVLSLLLSVAVLSMNISFVYAEERTLSDMSSTLENPSSETPSSGTDISSATSSQDKENADSVTTGGENTMGGLIVVLEEKIVVEWKLRETIPLPKEPRTALEPVKQGQKTAILRQRTEIMQQV